MGIFIKFECSKCGEYECDCSYEERRGKPAPSLKLYDYVFHYNPYNRKWRATTRDHYAKMFSTHRAKEVLSADTIEDLIKQIETK